MGRRAPFPPLTCAWSASKLWALGWHPRLKSLSAGDQRCACERRRRQSAAGAKRVRRDTREASCANGAPTHGGVLLRAPATTPWVRFFGCRRRPICANGAPTVLG